MAAPDGDWQVSCGRERFDECQKDERFPYIVALARAVNSIKFVHSAMVRVGQRIGRALREVASGRLEAALLPAMLQAEGVALSSLLNGDAHLSGDMDPSRSHPVSPFRCILGLNWLSQNRGPLQ